MSAEDPTFSTWDAQQQLSCQSSQDFHYDTAQQSDRNSGVQRAAPSRDDTAFHDTPASPSNELKQFVSKSELAQVKADLIGSVRDMLAGLVASRQGGPGGPPDDTHNRRDAMMIPSTTPVLLKRESLELLARVEDQRRVTASAVAAVAHGVPSALAVAVAAAAGPLVSGAMSCSRGTSVRTTSLSVPPVPPVPPGSSSSSSSLVHRAQASTLQRASCSALGERTSTRSPTVMGCSRKSTSWGSSSRSSGGGSSSITDRSCSSSSSTRYGSGCSQGSSSGGSSGCSKPNLNCPGGSPRSTCRYSRCDSSHLLSEWSTTSSSVESSSCVESSHNAESSSMTSRRRPRHWAGEVAVQATSATAATLAAERPPGSPPLRTQSRATSATAAIMAAERLPGSSLLSCDHGSGGETWCEVASVTGDGGSQSGKGAADITHPGDWSRGDPLATSSSSYPLSGLPWDSSSSSSSSSSTLRSLRSGLGPGEYEPSLHAVPPVSLPPAFPPSLGAAALSLPPLFSPEASYSPTLPDAPTLALVPSQAGRTSLLARDSAKGGSTLADSAADLYGGTAGGGGGGGVFQTGGRYGADWRAGGTSRCSYPDLGARSSFSVCGGGGCVGDVGGEVAALAGSWSNCIVAKDEDVADRGAEEQEATGDVLTGSIAERQQQQQQEEGHQQHGVAVAWRKAGSDVATAAVAGCGFVSEELLDATASEALRLTGLVSHLQRQLCKARAELAGRDAAMALLQGQLVELASGADVDVLAIDW